MSAIQGDIEETKNKNKLKKDPVDQNVWNSKTTIASKFLKQHHECPLMETAYVFMASPRFTIRNCSPILDVL